MLTPERIWFHPLIGDDFDGSGYRSKQFEGDTEYVRVDKYKQLEEENERLKTMWKATQEYFETNLSSLQDVFLDHIECSLKEKI